MKTYHHLKEKGQALMIAVIFFLLISMSLVMGVIGPTVHRIKMVREVNYSRESYFAAEALVEDIVYRLNNSMDVASAESLTINNTTVSVEVTTTSSGKTIQTTGDTNGHIRKISTSVSTGSGVSFSYGVQTGDGGFDIGGGSSVVGNVYSNGSIMSTDGGVITGTAISASSVFSTADQSNTAPTIPTNSVLFRNTTATRDFAQSFMISSSSPLSKIRLYIKKVGTPADAVVHIVNNNAGSPGTTEYATPTGTLYATQVPTSNYGWVDIIFPSAPDLTVGSTYWLVIESSTQSSSNYYQIGANTSYANGVDKIGKYTNTWLNTSPSGLDAYFELYLGEASSFIGGGTYAGALTIGTGGVGDAWATNVSGTTVAGTIYCQAGAVNNKACNTTRSSPPTQGFPLSDGNSDDWKEEASSGSITTGNITVGSTGATMGPRKIIGNLLVNGGGTLTLTGPLWVTGNVTVTSGGKVKLASSMGSASAVLMSDTWISLGGGGSLTGSGTEGSYLLIISTSDCPTSSSCGGNSAINIAGGAGAFLLNAQNGTINFSGAANAKEVTAKKVSVTGGSTITHETGLANMNFTSGPSGSWNIQSWKEVE